MRNTPLTLLTCSCIAVDPQFERHVSFASPPVNSTFPAASYPSSPESTRSPPTYFPHTGALATPNYRTAIQSDPFEDLTTDRREDGTLQQAVHNAQNNIAISQPPVQPELPEQSAVWNTLSRFSSAPAQPPVSSESRPSLPDSRKSLDVDAFKRLLLTGNTDVGVNQEQQSIRRPAPPPPRNIPGSNPSTSGAPETSFSTPSSDTQDSKEIDAKRASFINSLTQPDKDKTPLDATGKLPPPAPAPRRAKTVRSRDISPLPAPLTTESAVPSETVTDGEEKLSKRPPAPPVARRSSQRFPSYKSDDSANTPSPTASPAEPTRPVARPPPPPMRRQASTSRRPSQDLAPTLEESESDTIPAQGDRQSSIERPVIGSRNSSQSIKRASQGLMSPPPLPPPRKGRGSSRSSMDGFRPSLATLMGDEDGQGNTSFTDKSQPSISTDRSSLTASNADSILAELADLQKQVDAARHS